MKNNIYIYNLGKKTINKGIPIEASVVTQCKESAYDTGDTGDVGSIPVLERSFRGANGNPVHILAWRSPWTEEPGAATVHEVTRQLGMHT